MIYTLTFNPSIDYYLVCDHLSVGDINRIDKYEFIAGGKGINASRMLAEIGIENSCVFLAGGFSGAFLVDEVAKDARIRVIPIKVEEPNRINVKIRHEKETDLNTKGPQVSKEAEEELLTYFEKLEEKDYVIISGSLQNKELVSSIQKIAELVNPTGAKLVLDVPNMSLEQIIETKASLIKPNLEELQAMLESDKRFPEILEEAREKILKKGVGSILLSMGGDGGCYVDHERSYWIQGPKLKPLNTVAAGDSMLSVTIGYLSEGHSIEESICYGAAAGSAAVMAPYIPSQQQIEEMVKEIKVVEL